MGSQSQKVVRVGCESWGECLMCRRQFRLEDV